MVKVLSMLNVLTIIKIAFYATVWCSISCH